MRSLTVLALASLFVGSHPRGQSSPSDLPVNSEAIMRKVREAARFDYEIQTEFTYLERRRDIRLSTFGKVSVGPLRTFQVYPSSIPGRTYKRLIEVDGKALTAAELARRDDEHQKALREEEERRRTETPRQREARSKAEADEMREREAVLDDVLAVFQVTFVRREIVDGQPLLIGTATPRPSARTTTREGRWLKQFAGEVWISETDLQTARLDMHALDDVSIGWGIVGRVHKGSRFLFVRRKVEGAWLPSEVTIEATGRTLLFRRFQIASTTTFSDYKRQAGNR